MRQFLLSSSGASTEWLIYLAILLVACFFIGCFIVWFTVLRKQGKKRRKHRRHHRHRAPSLAELGGLPPRREDKDVDDLPPSP